MARKDRSKQLWLIPKRSSLTQTVGLVGAVLKLNYDGTVWSPGKQNNLGAQMAKFGVTRSGRNISDQSVRTLTASLPQSLGFLYLDTTEKPHRLRLTEAGRELWKQHAHELGGTASLRGGGDALIPESPIALRQLEKWQLTNPVSLKNCREILLFPFRFLLRVLRMTEYLDPEEIALFLFHAQQESDLMPVVEAVRAFRALPAAGRAKQVADFRATPAGQITLVKAPSSRYFAKLCLSSGLLEEEAVQPANAAKKLPALRIRPDRRAYVDDLLDRRYALAEPFDFGTDLQLWMDYLGNPARDFPPIAVTLQNPAPADLLLQVTQNGRSCCGELFPAGGSCTVPMFPGEEYLAEVISPLNGALLASYTITPDFSRRVFSLASGGLPPAPDTVAGLCAKIRALCAAKTVTPEIADYLKLLRRVFGREPKSEKALRGAYLEYYVYRLLRLRERDGVIDSLHWNGSVGQFGLPAAAPGGRDGKPDITFAIGATDFVLELTTIRSSRAQHQAEGASVPAHVIGWQKKTGRDTAGVFSAPLIYEDNSRLFRAALAAESSPARITSITLDELLDVLATGGRRQIFDRLARPGGS